MHGLILAGGEGTRLAAGGIALPKPLVEGAGRPQLLRLLETLDALGCESLTCAVRAELPAVAALLEAGRVRGPFLVMTCRTPSSLHTLAEAVPGHAVAGAVGRGLERMRGFLQAFVAGGARVATVDVARIIDIDRPSDLQVANAWLTAPDASEPEV